MLGIIGLREDGRKPLELRKLECRLGALNSCSETDLSGFCEIAQGCNKVKVSIYGPRSFSKSSGNGDQDKPLKCLVNVANFSKTEYKLSDMHDRKSKKIASDLENIFNNIIFKEHFESSELLVKVDVIESDGSILETAINATTMALINAGISIKDFVTALTVAYANRKVCVDLNHSELTKSQIGGSSCLLIVLVSKNYHTKSEGNIGNGKSEPAIVMMKTLNNQSFNKSARLKTSQVKSMTKNAIFVNYKLIKILKSILREHILLNKK